jgi:putative membrane protein
MLNGILVIWAVTAVGLGIVTLLLPGVRVKSMSILLAAALILGLVNAFIRPVLWLLTMPLTVLTFGLFALVINALMIMLTAALVKGFEVDGFGSALLAALIMALLGLLGFVLLEWWLMGDVQWIYYEHRGGGYAI